LANAVAAAQNRPPNIVFIFADDWDWGDLSCHGHPYVKTPNIDRLAKEGTDFHRFTVASGVSSPSRTAVMTGHFPARYNIDGHFAREQRQAQHAGLARPETADAAAPAPGRRLRDRALREMASRERHDSGFAVAEGLRRANTGQTSDSRPDPVGTGACTS
jgi:arylsulfatase A-like enzyme